MIGTVQVKVQAAMPNHPLQPLFAFKGSPSSMRIMDVPKKIGEWEIKEVSVLVKYPDNTQAEKVAVRTGNVWIATVEGCETTGRVVKGYEVLASGIDENGNDVSGYVLGSGDVFILERDSSIPEKGVEKFYVKFCEDLPANPQKGDIVDDGGTVKMYDGTKWIDMGGGSAEEIGDATLTIKKNGTNVGSFTANSFLNKTIDIAVPSTTSDLVNDSGFITSAAIPSEVSAFENDVGYITAEAIPSQVSSFENDAGYITASALPTKVSELENDSGYITESAIPSNVGAFQNDVGYLTSVSWGEVQDKPDVALRSEIPSMVGELENDAGYITASAIPSNISSFNNDVGYITASAIPAIPSQTSDLQNDSGFITASAIPTNISSFNNDVGYLTASDVSTSSITPSSGSDVKMEIAANGNLVGKKMINETGVWYVKGVYVDTTQIYNYWTTAFPTLNDNTLTGWIQDKQGQDAPYQWSVEVPTGTTAKVFSIPYHSLRIQVKKTEENEIPVWVETGWVPMDANNFHIQNVSQLNNDAGYLTTSSSAFTAKRDKTDMSAVVGTTYASWNLSALHSATYSPALELKWGTYNVFGEEQECWLVDDEYRQVCFFLLPELNMLYWGVRNQDGSYIAGYGETITLSSHELSIATINGVAEITCTRTSKEGSPEVSTIATMKDLRGFQNINEKRDWWDNTTPASVDATGKFTINTFSVMVGSSSYVLDQFSKSGSTSTWKTTSGDYPNITTTDGLNFTLNYDSSTIANFTMGELKPGPAKGTIGGSNFNVYANFMLTTYAMKDYVDAKLSTKREENDMGYIWYDVSDSVYRGIARWKISGLKTSGGTVLADFYTIARGTGNPTYYTYWNNGPNVIWTRDGYTMIVSINNPSEPPTFRIDTSGYKYNVFKVSYVDGNGVQQNLTLTADFPREYFAFKSYVNDKATVSGIGCSTVTMSGVYADTTTFSYNVVVQPSS